MVELQQFSLSLFAGQAMCCHTKEVRKVLHWRSKTAFTVKLAW
jgi:hypothetical protein